MGKAVGVMGGRRRVADFWRGLSGGKKTGQKSSVPSAGKASRITKRTEGSYKPAN